MIEFFIIMSFAVTVLGLFARLRIKDAIIQNLRIDLQDLRLKYQGELTMRHEVESQLVKELRFGSANRIHSDITKALANGVSFSQNDVIAMLSKTVEPVEEDSTVEWLEKNDGSLYQNR